MTATGYALSQPAPGIWSYRVVGDESWCEAGESFYPRYADMPSDAQRFFSLGVV
jgi:hypothetical protein